MSAPAAPQITLEQARQLVVFLENGEQDKANQLILETASQEQSQLFAEVGKLTRQLHEALKSFELDTRLTDITTDAIPDAKKRLNYVMEMTENAAIQNLWRDGKQSSPRTRCAEPLQSAKAHHQSMGKNGRESSIPP